MDDAQLLHRYVAEGSEAAFSELVGRHLNLVHSAALRQVGGDFHRAKDVTQMVFNLLARKAALLTHHTALTGWLYSTTHFVASPLMRSERRRKVREEETHRMNTSLGHPEPEIDWNQLRPVLDAALLRLNERDREAILWRFFDALPIAVLGEKLGVSETAAQKRVDRALDKMRASLTKHGANSTTAALALMLADHAVAAAPAGLAETVSTAAVASAAGAGSQGSWLLKLLGKTKLAAGVSGLIWAGGILSLPVIGAAVYEFWAARQAQAALAMDRERYQARLEDFRAAKRVASSSRLAALPRPGSSPAARDPKVDFQKFLLIYPQARAKIIAEQRSLAVSVYGSFFQSAGLTASQIEQVEDLLAEDGIGRMTITPGTMEMVGGGMPSEDRMRAILGDRAYRQFQDYNRAANAHSLAYAIGMHVIGAPLSADQLDQLAQILVSNNASLPSEGLNTLSSLASTNWDTVLSQAKAIISASQWKAAEPALLSLQADGASLKAQQISGGSGNGLDTVP